MNGQLLAIQCQMLACQARMEAMKAYNVGKANDGYNPLYGSGEFFQVERELEQLALEARNA